MARGLRIFAQLQIAKEVMHNECSTLASYVTAVNCLSGGTATNGALHVTNSVNELVEVYNVFQP